MSKDRRWYDRDQKSSLAIETILKLPPEMQQIICKAVMQLAEKEIKDREDLENFRSVGMDKILSLYKAKERKREYDRNDQMHDTLNYLGLLSEENRCFVSQVVLDIMLLIQEYLKMCQENDLAVRRRDFEDLTAAYVRRGSSYARQLLGKMEKQAETRSRSTP